MANMKPTSLNTGRSIVPGSRKIISRKRRMRWLGIVAGVVIVGLLVTFGALYLLPGAGQGKRCRDEACIVQAYADCEPAYLEENIEGTTAVVAVQDDCTISKRIEELDPDEPEEVRTLFQGAEMTCIYPEDRLTEDMVTVLASTDYCSGELADSIDDLRLAELTYG
ncbi:hypothetical protein GF351_02700 [Candidatus Woesearchaeota archaeon]|nr:hypothetical protein [Candidatus Woesearchaeota archaeon]